jgi:hypothetical protein
MRLFTFVSRRQPFSSPSFTGNPKYASPHGSALTRASVRSVNAFKNASACVERQRNVQPI